MSLLVRTMSGLFVKFATHSDESSQWFPDTGGGLLWDLTSCESFANSGLAMQ